MQKKKKRLLWPITNCCLKKFYDLDSIAKYGSILVVLVFLLFQIFNVAIGYNYGVSFVSMIINTFFLIVIFAKLEILKITIIEKTMNSILKFMIFVFILNFFAYLSSNIQLHNYLFAPMSFLGAYFIFLLLAKK